MLTKTDCEMNGHDISIWKSSKMTSLHFVFCMNGSIQTKTIDS